MNFSLISTIPARRWVAVMTVLLVAVSTASCGLFGKKDDKQPAYYAAREVPDLTIPEGLSRPESTNALVIQTPPAPLPSKELQSLPPRVSSQADMEDQNASIRWGTAGIYLHVEDSQKSVNRRLSYAAKRSGFNYREQPGGNGMIIQYRQPPDNSDKGFFSKLAFWRDEARDYSGEYLIVTEADGENTRIYLKNPDGSDCEETTAEHLLLKLDERLG